MGEEPSGEARGIGCYGDKREFAGQTTKEGHCRAVRAQVQRHRNMKEWGVCEGKLTQATVPRV